MQIVSFGLFSGEKKKKEKYFKCRPNVWSNYNMWVLTWSVLVLVSPAVTCRLLVPCRDCWLFPISSHNVPVHPEHVCNIKIFKWITQWNFVHITYIVWFPVLTKFWSSMWVKQLFCLFFFCFVFLQHMNLRWRFSANKTNLTHCSWETRKRVIGKQCRPRSDAAEHGVFSGSPLFANNLAIFL